MRRVIGPHTLASFATEYRAFVFNVRAAGFELDEKGAKIDPRLRHGLYVGPSRGHVDVDKAAKVGVPRAYGYGASMGAWVTDYVAYWAGHEGFIRYSNTAYRASAYEGDVTYLEAEVSEKEEQSAFGAPLVKLDVTMRNQDHKVLATGKAHVELPR